MTDEDRALIANLNAAIRELLDELRLQRERRLVIDPSCGGCRYPAIRPGGGGGGTVY